MTQTTFLLLFHLLLGSTNWAYETGSIVGSTWLHLIAGVYLSTMLKLVIALKTMTICRINFPIHKKH